MGPTLLKNIITELDGALSGGVVSKIHQSDERNVIIKVFARGREERLLISAHPVLSRMHLTDKALPNPPAPLRFCAFLRSRITNALIEGFTQAEGERIAHIRLKKRGEPGQSFTLIAELTGKSANIILIDDSGVILDALRYFPRGAKRIVEPGVPFTPLPSAPGPYQAEKAVEKREGETWNGAADRLFTPLFEKELEEAGRRTLLRTINEAEKKARRKLENLLGDRARAEEELYYTRLGELLSANLKKIKRGMTEAEVDDYTKYPPEKVRIRLDVKLSPRENAERCFKRAKKAKVAIAMLKDRIPETEAELEYIQGLIYEWETASTAEDLEALRDELTEGGYIRKMEEKAGAVEERKEEPIRRFVSSEGFEILCGKSGTGNDLIVKKYAKDGDIWFHASKVPGSHVLVKAAGRSGELTKKTIEEAASLAAWHSKNQAASKAEVVYTEARNVRKPRGAKPGLVTIKDFKTIVVRPKGMG